MFGKLAYEKRKNQVNADHRVLIREAALDVTSATPSDEIQMDELDLVIAADAKAVSDNEVNDLDSKIGELVDGDAVKDVTVMTKEEIQEHVADNSGTLTINELNS